MDTLSDYDYFLPEEAVAQTPLEDRAKAKLLWLHKKTGKCSHHTFSEMVKFLEKGDLLVLNNTRVSAKRLFGARPTGGQVEALLLRRTSDPREFIALMKPGKRLRPGAVVEFEPGLKAEIGEDLKNGLKRLWFSSESDLEKMWDQIGQIPLPPYIKAPLALSERYQTVYASEDGSAAAPTAGLHFTPEILCLLQEKGVELAFVTLDVGIDTFRPIQEEKITDVKIQKVKLGNQDLTGPFLTHQFEPVILIFGPLRDLIEIQGKGADLTTYRMAYTSTLKVPENGTKLGGKWSADFNPNTKTNFLGGKANYELVSLEKLNGTDALKVKWNYKEIAGQQPVSAEGLAWLHPKDGSIIKMEIVLNNAPIAGLPMPLQNVKFIQERVK